MGDAPNDSTSNEPHETVAPIGVSVAVDNVPRGRHADRSDKGTVYVPPLGREFASAAAAIRPGWWD